MTRIRVGRFAFVLAILGLASTGLHRGAAEPPGKPGRFHLGDYAEAAASAVHVHYVDNAIIPPYLGTDTVNRTLVYGDYVPVYMSRPNRFNPYPTSDPPYRNLWPNAQAVIAAAENASDPLHAQAVNFRPMAEALLAMESRRDALLSYLTARTLPPALGPFQFFRIQFNGLPPSSAWSHDPPNSLQAPYHPQTLRSLDATFIAPMNQWNSVTFNPSEEYIEALDEILHPVPDLSFLQGIFNQHGPLWEFGTALADIATPWNFLPALLMMGFDLYLSSQQEIGFLHPTPTGHALAPMPGSGLVMIKKGANQMIYDIAGGDGGAVRNIPSGDYGIFFVEAVNAFGGELRPTSGLTNADRLEGGRIGYAGVPDEFRDRDLALNLESHVGVGQTGKWLYDTVVCRIEGSGTLVMIPFKIGCWFESRAGQEGDLLSQVKVGVRFKNGQVIHSRALSDCRLEGVREARNGVLMWSGTAIFDAQEYGEEEIVEIYLTSHSGALRKQGLNPFDCRTSVSFSPYFLKPIVEVPVDREAYPGEPVTFQTRWVERPAGALVDVRWKRLDTGTVLEGDTAVHTFPSPGAYRVQMIVDPRYDPRPPAVKVTDEKEIFWNSPAGRMEWTFGVDVLPPVDLEVGWELPACVPLNTRGRPGVDVFPGRAAAFKVFVTNKGNRDFAASPGGGPSETLELGLFVDRDRNTIFASDEKIWSTTVDRLAAKSSTFFNLDETFCLDRTAGDTAGQTPVYTAGRYAFRLQATILSQETNTANNALQAEREFVRPPEMAIPDFAVENPVRTVDAYRNLALSFTLADHSPSEADFDKWRSCRPGDAAVPQWGPVSYQVDVADGHGFQRILAQGSVDLVRFHETIPFRFDPWNLQSLPAGRYYVRVTVNGTNNPAESNSLNNTATLDWFELSDEAGLPWAMRGGDRGHGGWKNRDVRPPLLTEWTAATTGFPVAVVSDDENIFVLTAAGTLEKFTPAGERLYSRTGFDGTPIRNAALVLLHPGTDGMRILAFTSECRMTLVDPASGQIVWTSAETFVPTVFGSESRPRDFGRAVDYDGRRLAAGWPLTLYRLEAAGSAPALAWRADYDAGGELFLLENSILAGHRLYAYGGEILERLTWMSSAALRRQGVVYSGRKRYDTGGGTTADWPDLSQPGGLLPEGILTIPHPRRLAVDGTVRWTMPGRIPLPHFPSSTGRSLSVYASAEPVLLGDGQTGVVYLVNHGHQLLAVDLAGGAPLWYREFVLPSGRIEELRTGLPPDMSRRLGTGRLIHQTPLNMAEGMAVDITTLIPFQNSLLVGTIDGLLRRLSPVPAVRLAVEGFIPSRFFGASRISVRVKALDGQGGEVALEDKITVTGPGLDNVGGRLYRTGEEIRLNIDLPEKVRRVVDLPEEPAAGSNEFAFIDVQDLSAGIRGALRVENILPSLRAAAKDPRPGERTVLAVDSDADLAFVPRSERGRPVLQYVGFGNEDARRVVFEHGFLISISRTAKERLEDLYESIEFHAALPQGTDASGLRLKADDRIYDSASGVWAAEGHVLTVDVLALLTKSDDNSLRLYILRPGASEDGDAGPASPAPVSPDSDALFRRGFILFRRCPGGSGCRG